MSKHSPADILEEPVSGDDLTAEIADAGGGRSKVTTGLVLAVLLLLAFGAGAWSRSALLGGTTPVQADDKAPTVLTGTINSAANNTIDVTGSNGKHFTVTLPPPDQISLARKGSTADLKPGAQVRIEGRPGQGSFAASHLTATPG